MRSALVKQYVIQYLLQYRTMYNNIFISLFQYDKFSICFKYTCVLHITSKYIEQTNQYVLCSVDFQRLKW